MQTEQGRVTLTSVDGIEVGHHTRPDRPTGCTVVLARDGAVGGVSVRGAAPGSREIALLRPENTVDVVHAVVLTGGSALGLGSAQGVVEELRDAGIGFPVGNDVVPIVPAAVLFDLGLGGNSYPTAEDGAAALRSASTAPPAEGNVGAGAGATVGKMLGSRSMKGGIGTAGFRFEDGTVVAAIVAVNCRGDVRDPRTGQLVAGGLDADGRLRDAEQQVLGGARSIGAAGENTTIGVVATNRTLTKVECSRLADVAHDGLARAVVPAHTRFDGDTLFALATGTAPAPRNGGDYDRLEIAAAAAVSAAILSGVRHAETLLDIPGAAG